MPWSAPVEEDLRFWLAVCDVAASGYLWNRLEIDIDEALGVRWPHIVAGFRTLVAQVSDELITSPPPTLPSLAGGCCKEHGVVLHPTGDDPSLPARCAVCGDLRGDGVIRIPNR